jgi:hypothetical protein
VHHSDANTPGQHRARPDPRIPLSRQGQLESIDRARRPYVPPRLMIYGRLEELTLTVNDNMNKNDPVQGGNNLKT